MTINNLIIETEDTLASLLELAANNDIDAFRRWIEHDKTSVHEVGLWYGRQKGSKQMVLEQRTPLMVAATYGSIDIIKLILSLPDADVNRSCGFGKSTALHCAASGGSQNAAEAVKLLLQAGADRNSEDVSGRCPIDVVVVSPSFRTVKSCLENLLLTGNPLPIAPSNSNSPPRSPSPGNKRDYPIDPSFPDIKNDIYSTDEFRMFSFKIRPCSRAYSHDWTDCPFLHPGENARRRDPRKYHYSCVPCPEFRKGACQRGDLCEYAHGVFECWLHPAQYRTRICKDGVDCNRRVCFFAHTHEEMRPLYVSTGSAVPGANAMDFAASVGLLPGSPSSISAMSPSPFTPPMSPSGNGTGWPHQNVPALHLPGSFLQSSRLRSSLNARDFDVQQQLLNEMNRSVHPMTLAHANLEDLFSGDSLSPRFPDQAGFSPTRKSAAACSQFQQQQSMLSPIKTNFSPRNVDHPLLQASFGVPSPRAMEPISPISPRVSMLSQRDQQQQFRSLSSRDLGSNFSPIVGSPADNIWSNWGTAPAKPDRSVNTEEFSGLRRSSSFELTNNGEEPDLSWVQSLVKESPPEMTKDKCADLSEGSTSSSKTDQLSAWMEQMKLDQLMAL